MPPAKRNKQTPKGRGLVVRPELVGTIAGSLPGLDGVLDDGMRAVEESVALWRDVSPMVTRFRAGVATAIQEAETAGMEPKDAHDIMQHLSGALERQARVVEKMVKAVDTVARLRTFLQGGVAPPIALEGKSDADLERLVVEMALATGKVVRADGLATPA